MFFSKSGTAFSGRRRRGPESFSSIARFALIAGFMTLAAAGFFLSQHSSDEIRSAAAKLPLLKAGADAEQQQAAAAYDGHVSNVSDSGLHPIDRLIAASRSAHDDLVAKQSHDVATAAD